MKTPTHEFVTVDMRGMKAALVARAQGERVSVSTVVRRAIERELGLDVLNGREASELPATVVRSFVKVSLRLTEAEAELLAAGARRAGLSRGAFLAGLLTGVPSLTATSPDRPEFLAALHASCAELSTLSMNLHHLTSLLRQGQVDAARQYRQMLDTLRDDVRSHLRMASSALAELRPSREARGRAEPAAAGPI